MNELPPSEQIASGIWSIPLAMPDVHNPWSFCYALAGTDGSIHLVDPGLDSDSNLAILTAALASRGYSLGDVTHTFSTHQHPDHIGLADRIRRLTGSVFAMPARELSAIRARDESEPVVEATLDRWQVLAGERDDLRMVARTRRSRPPVEPDLLLAHGDPLPLTGRSIALVATPGHTPGHACLIDNDARVFFSGDHVLPQMFPGIGLGGPSETNPIADYFDSLARVAEYDDCDVAPGHGYRFRGLAARAHETRRHHLRRSREVALILNDRPDASVSEVAPQLIWTAGWDRLRGFARFSALGQTALHMDFVRSAAGQQAMRE